MRKVKLGITCCILFAGCRTPFLGDTPAGDAGSQDVAVESIIDPSKAFKSLAAGQFRESDYEAGLSESPFMLTSATVTSAARDAQVAVPKSSISVPTPRRIEPSKSLPTVPQRIAAKPNPARLASSPIRPKAEPRPTRIAQNKLEPTQVENLVGSVARPVAASPALPHSVQPNTALAQTVPAQMVPTQAVPAQPVATQPIQPRPAYAQSNAIETLQTQVLAMPADDEPATLADKAKDVAKKSDNKKKKSVEESDDKLAKSEQDSKVEAEEKEEGVTDLHAEYIVPPQPQSGPVTAPISVAEAVRMALSQNKAIMVLGYEPQELGTAISTERAAFDPVVAANIEGGKLDRQLANFIDSGGAIGGAPEQQTDFFGQPERNILSISKLMESGGVAEIGIGSRYLFQDPAGILTFVNPAWNSALNFRFTQPLLRGRGSEVTTAPLRIARAAQTEAAHLFQTDVNIIIRDVQLAYWDWKLTMRDLEVRRDAVETAKKTFEQVEESMRLGEGTAPDVEQARAQLQQFRIDAQLANNDMVQARIRLAQGLGLPLSQANNLDAIDNPNTDLLLERELGEATALLRPEIQALRAKLQAAEIEVRVACNNLQSDLNFQFDYAITGLEGNLDDAFDTVFDNQFNDWIVRLEYRRAVGLRAEYAEMRRAKLALSRIRAE